MDVRLQSWSLTHGLGRDDTEAAVGYGRLLYFFWPQLEMGGLPRHCEDAVNAFETTKVGNYFPACNVEDHHMVGIHVRDIQSTAGCIEILIVKADCRPWQGNIGNLDQRFMDR